MTEEKNYKPLIETEYYKSKKHTVDALKRLSVEDLCVHIKAYKEYMLTLVMDHEEQLLDNRLQHQTEKQLRTIDQLETFLSDGISNALVHIMLDEDIILHLIDKLKKDQTLGACCKTPF